MHVESGMKVGKLHQRSQQRRITVEIRTEKPCACTTSGVWCNISLQSNLATELPRLQFRACTMLVDKFAHRKLLTLHLESPFFTTR
jgi:hypothetical protein